MNLQLLASEIKAGQRRALARGLTLVESAKPAHEQASLELFSALGPAPRAFRLGVTGPPGAGKSTLIERLALSWVKENDLVAVLAVDPSSQRTGGSLLGDKTRMGEIAHHSQVFVRPSPTGEHLGGLGRRTSLMCALLECAGYSKIIIETVGVGQSEVSAKYLVDRLLLVALPGAGDEVQGIKRGLMEEVDLVAVNKADLGQAKATVAILRSAFRVFRRDVPVLDLSAHTGYGMEALLDLLATPVVLSDAEQVRGELHFFDQFLMDSIRKIVRNEDSAWSELRQRIQAGETDFLQSLPLLVPMMEKLRCNTDFFVKGEPCDDGA